MNPTVYVETSVVSYLTARPSRDVVLAAYQEVTREWWRTAQGRFVLYASALVISESAAGDTDAARARLNVLSAIPVLEATEEAVELTRTLLDGRAVPPNAGDDAAHIRSGYRPPVICTPNELMEADDAEADRPDH